MALPPESILTFRALLASPVIGVQDYCCRACRGGPEAEEQSGSNTIVIMRHGAFSKHFGPRRVTADVNEAVFFSKDSTYRVSHPADCGDRGTVFEPAPRVLDEIIHVFDPSVEDRPGRPFPFVTGPCDSGVFWRHLALVRRLESAGKDPLDLLAMEEAALDLVMVVLAAAFARHGQPAPRRRKETVSDHAERVGAAKAYLAGRLGQRVTLEDVSGAAHLSPFHFARLFREQTGLPVHQYLTRLRLRASLERLAEGVDDLTALALDLGFSSHSHFSDAFKREFGRTPSEVRGWGRHKILRGMSKNLEVRSPPPA